MARVEGEGGEEREVEGGGRLGGWRVLERGEEGGR